MVHFSLGTVFDITIVENDTKVGHNATMFWHTFLSRILSQCTHFYGDQILRYTGNHWRPVGELPPNIWQPIKHKKTLFHPLWPVKDVRCSIDNLLPTKMPPKPFAKQCQHFTDCQQPLYDLWQPAIDQLLSEVGRISCVTGDLAVQGWEKTVILLVFLEWSIVRRRATLYWPYR